MHKSDCEISGDAANLYGGEPPLSRDPRTLEECSGNQTNWNVQISQEVRFPRRNPQSEGNRHIAVVTHFVVFHSHGNHHGQMETAHSRPDPDFQVTLLSSPSRVLAGNLLDGVHKICSLSTLSKITPWAVEFSPTNYSIDHILALSVLTKRLLRWLSAISSLCVSLQCVCLGQSRCTFENSAPPCNTPNAR